MIRRVVLLHTPLLFTVVFLAPAASVAASEPPRQRPQGLPPLGMVVITSGSTISHLGDVAPQHQAELRKLAKRDTAVGFKYSYWGIFWLDLWTWGGEYCIYQGKTYDPIPPAFAATLLGIPESELGKPFNYKFPIGLLIVLGIGALCTLGALLNRKPTDPAAPLFKDERYMQALEVYSAHMSKLTNPVPPDGPVQVAAAMPAAPVDPTVAAFDAAIQHLLSLGIPREEAEPNMAMMLTALARAQA